MPHWNKTVNLADVWKNEDLTFEEQVEKIVERIKNSGWRKFTPYPHTFDELIENLEKSETKEAFNDVWEEVYDLADVDRVWIETF